MKIKLKAPKQDANPGKQNSSSNAGTENTNQPLLSAQSQTSPAETARSKYQSSFSAPLSFGINAQSLKQAFVYSEILGKPKARRGLRYFY